MKILYTKVNPASLNIAEELRKIAPELELTEFEKDVLDVPTNFKEEMLILSTHKSKSGEPMLTVHVPGNWGTADFGGENKTLNIVDANLIKKLLIGIEKYNRKSSEQSSLALEVPRTSRLELNWKVCLECDHHGPTCKVPITFIEIGSSEKEWGNKTAGKVIASAIKEAIETKDAKEYPIVFCIGEGHYSRKFTKINLESKYAVGHVLPKYRIKEFDEELFKQALEKNVGNVSKVLIDEECNRWQKDKIIGLCKRFEIKLEKV